MRVRYESESVLLHEYGNYAIHDSVRHPKFEILRDCVAIVLRWKSSYEGKRYGNVSNYTKYYKNWIVGPFVNQVDHPQFYSEDLEFKMVNPTRSSLYNVSERKCGNHQRRLEKFVCIN